MRIYLKTMTNVCMYVFSIFILFLLQRVAYGVALPELANQLHIH